MAVLAIAPLLMHLHDAVEDGKEILLGDGAKGLREGGNRRPAVLLPLSTADVDLEALESLVAHNRSHPHVVGEQFDAIVGNQQAALGIPNMRGDADLEFAVQQLGPVLELLPVISDQVGIDGEDLDKRLRWQTEVIGEALGQGIAVEGIRIGGERAGHDVADIVPAAIEAVESILGYGPDHFEEVLFFHPVELQVLARGDAKGGRASRMAGEALRELIEGVPLFSGDGAPARNTDPDHVDPFLLLAGLGAIELEIDPVGLRQLFRFPGNIGTRLSKIAVEIPPHSLRGRLVALLGSEAFLLRAKIWFEVFYPHLEFSVVDAALCDVSVLAVSSWQKKTPEAFQAAGDDCKFPLLETFYERKSSTQPETIPGAHIQGQQHEQSVRTVWKEASIGALIDVSREIGSNLA